jgi:hypothetical protein
MRKGIITLFLTLIVVGPILGLLIPASPVHAAYSVLSPTSGAVGARVDVNASVMYGGGFTYSIWFDVDGDLNPYEVGERIKSGTATGYSSSDFFIVPPCVGNRTGYAHIVIINDTASPGYFNTAYFSVVTSMNMSVPASARVGEGVPINITISGAQALTNYSFNVSLVDSSGNILVSPLFQQRSDDRGGLSTIRYYPNAFNATSQPGGYTLFAKVTDIPLTGLGTTTTLQPRFFQIQPLSNQLPTAYIVSITPNPAVAGQEVTFIGNGSDPDGWITRYRWTSSIDGWLSGLWNFSTSSLSVGVHSITFDVQDNYNEWSSPFSASFEVKPESLPPSAFIDSTLPNSITVGQRTTFSGHGEDLDGVIVDYRWTSSIDGWLSDSWEFSTSNLSVGTHTISFQVQDNSGTWSDEVTVTLEVKEATTLFWLLLVVGSLVVATGAFSLVHYSRPPSSTEVKRDLQKRQDREAKNEEKEKEKRKRKTERGKPFLDLEIVTPPRIMSATSYEAKLRVRNIGSSETKDINITADCTPCLVLEKQIENIPSLEAGAERALVFPFKVSEQVRKGVYALRFEVKSKETWTQVRSRYTRAVKIGILSNVGKQEYVEPLREWLKGKSYAYDELAGADQLVKCLLKYDLIILAPEVELPKQWMRNLAAFVENSQSLLLIDKTVTSEEKLLAELLGYDEIRYEPFRSDEGLLRICDNQHFITRNLAAEERIQLGPLWGNACVSRLTTGKSLTEHSVGEESDEIAVIPVLTINEFMEGKTAHLNFHAEKSLSQISLLFEKMLDWLLSEDVFTPSKPWSSCFRSLKLAPATLTELFKSIFRRKA